MTSAAKYRPGTMSQTVWPYLFYTDVDAHHDRAQAEGAEVFEELWDTPFGHRRYSCADPQGQWWSFATEIAV
jgi:uncharacterized glyoxalase superfamily protein PhnB